MPPTCSSTPTGLVGRRSCALRHARVIRWDAFPWSDPASSSYLGPASSLFLGPASSLHLGPYQLRPGSTAPSTSIAQIVRRRAGEEKGPGPSKTSASRTSKSRVPRCGGARLQLRAPLAPRPGRRVVEFRRRRPASPQLNVRHRRGSPRALVPKGTARLGTPRAVWEARPAWASRPCDILTHWLVGESCPRTPHWLAMLQRDGNTGARPWRVPTITWDRGGGAFPAIHDAACIHGAPSPTAPQRDAWFPLRGVAHAEED
jgi:hypothetical protein